MRFSTMEQMRSRVKFGLQEQTSKIFDPTELDNAIWEGECHTFAFLKALPFGNWGQEMKAFSLAAGVTTYDLSGLSGDFAAVKKLRIQVSGTSPAHWIECPRIDIEDLELHEAPPTSPSTTEALPGYFIYRERVSGVVKNMLRVEPESTISRNFELYAEFDPALKGTADSLDIPAKYERCVLWWAVVHLLKLVNKEWKQGLTDYHRFVEEMLHDERRAHQATGSESTRRVFDQALSGLGG